MDHRKYIEFLSVIEKLKCNTRHSWTSSGRRESVAEHSWRLAVMAMLCADEYPELAKKCNVTLPDEKMRRVGQSVAAASLPALK